MASIVFVSPDLPYPPDSGGNIKSFFLLQHLCAHHDVSLVTVLKGNSAAQVDALQAALPLRRILAAPVDRGRSMTNFAKSVVQRRTLNEYRTWSPELATDAEAMFEATDCIVVDHLEVMQYVPETHWPKVLLHTHNAEHQLWVRKAAITRSLPERVGASVEGRRIAARERRYANGVAAVLAAPDDQTALAAIGANRADFHRTFHLGDDTKLDLPDLDWRDTEPLVFYMGSLSWEPNSDGLQWFVEQAWPRVRAARHDAKLVIGGSNPPERLVAAAAADQSISVVGFIDDPEPYFTRARVSVAPLRFGSGMKLKVIESLTRGVPTVTTPIGVESIDAQHRKHIMIGDTPAELADAVLLLLSDRAAWEAMRNAGRALIRDNYTWDIVRADFDAALAQVLG